MTNYQVVQSVRIVHSTNMQPCLCIKEPTGKLKVPVDADDDNEREDLSFKLGKQYDFYRCESNENSADPQPYYGVRSYSSDFVAGTEGRIVDSGRCSTSFMDTQEFYEHFAPIKDAEVPEAL